jgi:branched-subunit amino acid aminotransferase/4-amino-4-deoxychorismate lyase
MACRSRWIDICDGLANSCCALELSNPLNDEALSREIHRLIEHGGGARCVSLPSTDARVRAAKRGVSERRAYNMLFWTRKLRRSCGRAANRCEADHRAGRPLATVLDQGDRSDRQRAGEKRRDRAGAEEAIFVDENGIVAEGSRRARLRRDRSAGRHAPGRPRVLPGVTRDVVIECAKHLGIDIIERPIQLHEAKRAAKSSSRARPDT